MKKVSTIVGIVFLATTLMSFQGKFECETECEKQEVNDITYIEMEEEVELGFDTAKYLPEGFDAYEGMEFDINQIEYIEEEEEIILDFDVQDYLPEGFETPSI